MNSTKYISVLIHVSKEGNGVLGRLIEEIIQHRIIICGQQPGKLQLSLPTHIRSHNTSLAMRKNPTLDSLSFHYQFLSYHYETCSVSRRTKTRVIENM